jgi:hypothetical protein
MNLTLWSLLHFLMFRPDDTPHTLPGKGYDWATGPVGNVLRARLKHIFMIITIMFNSALVEWAKRQGE